MDEQKITDIMEKILCKLRITMTFLDVLSILTTHKVNYAPVLNEDGTYLGIFHLKAEHYLNIHPNKKMKDFFSASQLSFSSDTSLSKVNLSDFVCPLMPVVHSGKLIGVVTKENFMKAKQRLLTKKIADLKTSFEKINNDYMSLQEIFDHSHDGFAIANNKGVTVKVNNAWDRITGLNRDDIIGKPLTDLVKKGYFSDSVSMKVFDRLETVTIIQKMNSGKKAFVTGKPFFDENGNLSKVIMNLKDITELHKLKEMVEEKEKLAEAYHTEVSQLRKKQTDREKIIAESKVMQELLYLANQVARVDSRVFLTGESGVGKGVVARYIHRTSHRENKPFITVNCGAIPKDLIESELFGYESGAFTGASPKGKIGLFELAHEGTLFLDEIAEIPLKSQVKLLNVLQDNKIKRVGGTKETELDVRIISATNRDLLQLVRENKFREDLYYRLNVVPISIPPLRKRKKDILPLTIYYLDLFNKRYNFNKKISPELMKKVLDYNWPGNIRELENFVERIIVTSNNDILASDYFSLHSQEYKQAGINGSGNSNGTTLQTLEEAQNNMESTLIKKALDKGGTQAEAARLLGISLSTLIRKMKKLYI